MRRKTRQIVMILIFSVIDIAVALSGCSVLFPPNAQNAEKLLVEDGAALEKIVQYFEDSNCENLGFVQYDQAKIDEVVEDQEVRDTITSLFDRGYLTISKRGNTIYFARWTQWRALSAGFAYSIDGTHLPVIEYLTKLEPLSKDHWYYYERR